MRNRRNCGERSPQIRFVSSPQEVKKAGSFEIIALALAVIATAVIIFRR